MKIIVGFILGFVVCLAYYDGFVAKEYKEKLTKASEALIRSHNQIKIKEEEIIKRDEQIVLLVALIEELAKQNQNKIFAKN